MTSPGGAAPGGRSRVWAALLVALAALLGVAAVAGPAAAAAPEPSRGAIVVLGVPDLQWSDLDPANTPAMWALAGRAGLGDLSVRTAVRSARCLDAWLTLGSGNRARGAHGPAMDDGVGASCDAAVPQPPGRAAVRTLQQAQAGTHFGVRVGALGAALHRAGLRTAAFGGPGAQLAAMDRSGQVDVTGPAVPQALAAALPTVALAVVELPQVYDEEAAASHSAGFDQGVAPGGAAYHPPTDAERAAALAAPRRAASHRVDTEVGRLLAAVRPQDTVLLLGLSDGSLGGPHLHVAMAAGPGFPSGYLGSASTGRVPFVQLIDAAPTILDVLGVPTPSSMVGQPWFSAGPREGTLASTVAAMVDANDAARNMSRSRGGFLDLMVISMIVVTLGATSLVAVRRFQRPRRNPARPVLEFLAYGVATMPVASWLAQPLHWYRHGAGALYAIVAVITLVVAGAAFALARATRPWAGAALVAAVTGIVLSADLVTGTHLQLSSVLGDSPLVAGRFRGVGNAMFGVYAGSMLLLAGIAAQRSAPGRRGLRPALVAGGIGALAVLLDGAPPFGDDFGGALALGPAVAVLVLLVSGLRMSWRRIVGVVAVGLVPVVAFALYDYSLPPDRQSHIGRFVGQLLHGDAFTVVWRKAQANVGSLASSVYRWPVLVAILLVAVMVWRHALRDVTEDRPAVRAGLWAVLIAAVVGAALNDSGIVVPGTLVVLVAPLLAAAWLRLLAQRGDWLPAARESLDDAASSSDIVTNS